VRSCILEVCLHLDKGAEDVVEAVTQERPPRILITTADYSLAVVCGELGSPHARHEVFLSCKIGVQELAVAALWWSNSDLQRLLTNRT
jgi:hypothetical protein